MKQEMEKIIEFFNENTSGFLATAEGNQPRVRPWTFLFEDGDKVWFLTTKNRRVYKELLANPYIEFCSYSKDLVSGRIGGKVEFCEDLEVKTRILEDRPALKKIYKTPDNPQFALFYIEHGSASLRSVSQGIDDYIEF